jgi:hypothetical protein
MPGQCALHIKDVEGLLHKYNTLFQHLNTCLKQMTAHV